MLEEQQIKERFNLLTTKLREIKSIFIEQFGEERVDINPDYTLQQDSFVSWYRRRCKRDGVEELSPDDEKAFLRNTTILVHWPEVTISNEFDVKHLIRDLYAKVEVTPNGTITPIGFRLNRTTYTDAEWASGYMHSHISNIPKGRLSEFQSPCMGSGPIRDVIHVIISNYDKEWWETFAFELDRYVRVESIAGVPYRRMANIVTANSNSRSSAIYLSSCIGNLPNTWANKLIFIQDFIRHCCANLKFKFSFNGSTYILAENSYEFWLRVSNEFIKYFNANKDKCEFTFKDMVEVRLLRPCILQGTYFREFSGGDIENYSESDTFPFKGVMQHLKIIRTLPLEQENLIYILSPMIAGRLYSVLPYIVDINYGKTLNK